MVNCGACSNYTTSGTESSPTNSGVSQDRVVNQTPYCTQKNINEIGRSVPSVFILTYHILWMKMHLYQFVCSCTQSLPNLARSPCRYWSCCSENSIHSNQASHCRRGHLLWHSEATCPESWLRSRRDPHSKGIEHHGWCFLELEPWRSGGWCWCFSLWQSAEHHPGTVCSKACWKLARQQYHHDTAKSLASSKLLLQAPAGAYQGTCHVGSYHHRFSSNLHWRHKCLGILLHSRLRVDPSLQAAVGMHPGFWRLDCHLRGCKANHPACSSWSYCHRGMYSL